jgi:hypothetical protein
MAPQGYGQAGLNGWLHAVADPRRRRFSRTAEFGQATPGWAASACAWCDSSTASHVPCAFVLVLAHAVQRPASLAGVAAASQALLTGISTQHRRM